ncbi:MAG: NAD(P)H-hydrate dehydratase [Actinomycetota bacterium]|nr:NAD(P)H-hydrate dehydratase [Actinomycetota bacterium]
MSEPSRSDLPRVLSPAKLREWPLPVPTGGAKKSRGTVLVVGGSRGTPGAVLLAGTAALRAGAGILQLAAPEAVSTALAIHVPESLVIALPQTDEGAVSAGAAAALEDFCGGAEAVLIGPGLYDATESQRLVAALLELLGPETAVALDAYALRGLTEDSLRSVAGRVVLTPNMSEATRLLGRDSDEGDEPEELARQLADRFAAVIALQGIVASPDGPRWADESGHAGLGTSGSGDVLAGLIAGLLARGAGPEQAACWGTHLHATAGERLAARIGRLGFLARELLDEAPLVLAELQA